MKKIVKAKYFIFGLIVGVSLFSAGVFASVTGAGTIGSLFEKVGSVYRLIGDNIKDNTIDSSEIEDDTIKSVDILDNTLTSNDLATNSVGNSELSTNAVYSINIKNGEVGGNDINSSQVQKRVIGTCLPGFYITGITQNGYVSCRKDQKGSGASYCSSSTLGKYRFTDDGTLQKCVYVPEDTKTISSGWKDGKSYYFSAKNDCVDQNKFGIYCPSGYYRISLSGSWGKCRRDKRVTGSHKKGKVEIYCKRNASYVFQTQ